MGSLGFHQVRNDLPLLPLVAVFGDAAVTYYFWPIVCSGLLASGLYLIAYRYWGSIFGILAVVLGLSVLSSSSTCLAAIRTCSPPVFSYSPLFWRL